MTAMDMIIQVLLFYAVFKLGQWSIIWPMRSALRKLAEKNGIDLDRLLREHVQEMAKEDREEQPGIEEEMTVERVDRVYYAYGEGGRFLAQGPDFRSMFDSIKQRFPGHSFRIRDYSTQFTEEEAGQMLRAVFEVFGKEQKQ